MDCFQFWVVKNKASVTITPGGGRGLGFCFSVCHCKVKFIYSVISSIAAAAAAKSLQSCPTLCNPIDSSPSGFSIPGILQARTLEWVAISFSNAGK